MEEKELWGDLPTQDISIQRYMAHSAFLYLKARMCLNDIESVNVLEGICYNMVTTVHVNTNWAYVHEKGNSSGQWCTSWFATFCTRTWMATCYYYNRPVDREEPFDDLVSQRYYGDDNLGSVSPECHWYDNLQIASALKELFGLGFTDPSKGEITTPWLELDEQIFLARKFVEKDGEFSAPLGEESLFGMLHYIRHHEHIDDRMQLLQNVEVFAQEMAHYEQSQADALWEVVTNAMHQAGIAYDRRGPEYWRPRRHEMSFQTYSWSSGVQTIY
jgi:hypothetical protein